MSKKFLLIILILTTGLVFGQNTKRAFTLDDIYRVKGVSAPVLNPEEDYMIFTVSELNLYQGSSKSTLYKLDNEGGEPKVIETGGKRVIAPFFDPEGKIIYFLSQVDGTSQLHSFNVESGEIKLLTNFYPGIDNPKITKDGKKIAFTAKVYPECGADGQCNKTNADAFADGPVHAHIADSLLFRHWTEYDDDMFYHTFLLDLTTGNIKDLTPGYFHSPIYYAGGGADFDISPDGQFLVVASNRGATPEQNTNSDLFLINTETFETKNITSQNLAWDGSPSFSPDGRYLAYRKQLVPGYESDKFRIALYNLSNGHDKILTEEIDNWVGEIHWADDSRMIYFTVEEAGYDPLYSIDVKSNEITKIRGEICTGGFSISNNGKSIFYTYRLNHLPAEIYRFDLSSKKEAQLTFFNKKLLEEVDFRPVEHLWVEGANGKKVHTMIVKPFGFDPSKKYPAVINIHGGPQSQWRDAFRGDNQVYAGAGYVYVIPNPHGSTGYGQEYTLGISGDYTGKIVEDIMKVTDAIENLDYVDKNRVGAMGWSFGGYMVNWLQGITDRYKCFASMMGLYDLESFYGTTEELWFPEFDLKGTPWSSDLYQLHSPSNNVLNFSTPTLVVTGKLDYRVSYNQSLQYFTALQKLKIPSRLIIFDYDGHWPSHLRSMPLYYNSHLEWFHTYLGGDPAPYDSKLMMRNRAYEGKKW